MTPTTPAELQAPWGRYGFPRLSRALFALLLGLAGGPAGAAEVSLAAAANFADPTKRLASRFAQATGHKLVASFGSSGKLAAQIENGAPFEIFLSADAERPAELEARGLAVPGTRFVYAIGKLALWSSVPDAAREAALKAGRFDHLAIANPKTAPYGKAAEQVLDRLGIAEAVRPKLVMGESIAQTFQFAATGNAQFAFVAQSQIRNLPEAERGSSWEPPAEMYEPIRQEAVLLKTGEGSAAARAFVEFLKGEEARAAIRGFGYDVP